MADEPRTLAPTSSDTQELDAQVEVLARQIGELINRAGREQRQDLREYALGLIKEETELIEAPGAPSDKTQPTDNNPLALALLLGVIAFPMGILFPFVGITMFTIALVLGVVGVVSVLIRR